MGGQQGRNVLISIGDGEEPEAFLLVAGIRARTISLVAGLVEATTAQSPGAWRELIAEAATKRAEVAGRGVFLDAASDARMRAAYFNGEAPLLRLVIPDFGTMTGRFQISELAYGGDEDDQAQIAIRLVSSGVVTFEAD